MSQPKIIDVQQIVVLALLVRLHQLHLPQIFRHEGATLQLGVLLALRQGPLSLLLRQRKGVFGAVRPRLGAHVPFATQAVARVRPSPTRIILRPFLLLSLLD